MNMSNYFDLKTVWVNELVGDIWIFLFVGLIMIWIVSAKAKIPFQVASLLSIIWVGLSFAAIATSEFMIVWALVIMFAAFILYYGVAKLLK